jgi:hypothetical protein
VGCAKLEFFFFVTFDENLINMSTLNTIMREMKDVPVNRLEELYQFIHSMTPQAKHSDGLKKRILSFGGAFSDMSSTDYADFLSQTKKSRTDLFDRKLDL